MNIFINYYVICLVYCFYQTSKTWRRLGTEGGLGITPGLDSIMLILLCWALAPVDFFLRWITFYKKADESRIRNSKFN
jgi:hypothetical protein